MREIKFRAWDKEMNCWYEPIFKAYENKIYELLISFSGDLVMKTMSPFLDHESLFPDRFELMQYTGLKDKNGKEIYEGDIIHVTADEYEPEYKGEVKWYTGYFGFDEFYPDGTLSSVLFLSSYHDFGEVIGNIYENPELIA